jgi:hypothetical protein
MASEKRVFARFWQTMILLLKRTAVWGAGPTRPATEQPGVMEEYPIG